MPLTKLLKPTLTMNLRFFLKTVWNKNIKNIEELKGSLLAKEIANNYKMKVPEMTVEALIRTSNSSSDFINGFIKGFYITTRTNSAKDLLSHIKPFFDKIPELKESLEKKDLADNSESIHSTLKCLQNGLALKSLNNLKIGHFEINQQTIHGKNPDFILTKPDGTKIFVEFKTPVGPKIKVLPQLKNYVFPHKIAVNTRNIQKIFIKKPAIIYFDSTAEEILLIQKTRLKAKLLKDPIDYTGVSDLWDSIETKKDDSIFTNESDV
jgi:hypothetical protein